MEATSKQDTNIIPGMQAVFWASVVLVFTAGFALFVLTGSTEALFAWTIGSRWASDCSLHLPRSIRSGRGR